MDIKNNKGITLVALVTTVVILLIIAGISVYSGMGIIRYAKIEELRTNMLLIKAKGKEYLEVANFRLGPNQENESQIDRIREEIYLEQGLKKVVNEITLPSAIPTANLYLVTNETLEEWGLSAISKAEGEEYLISFDERNLELEVYSSVGYDNKYSLTEIEQIEL